MGFILSLLNEQTVIAVLQVVVGGWAKKQAWFANKFIPALTYIVALVGFTLAPASAHAASLLGSVAGQGGNVLLLAGLQNLFVTGTHSTWKNFVVPTFWDAVKILAGRLEQKVVKEKVED